MAYLPGLGDCYGYVEGYRYWLWEGRLRSLVTDTFWHQHQALEARDITKSLTTPPPGWPTQNGLPSMMIYSIYHPGIHAYKSRPEDNIYWSAWSVLGRVALWGTIVEHEDGYRAQFAYPVEFLELNYRTPEGYHHHISPGRYPSLQDLTRLYLTPPGDKSCKSETQLELIQSPQLKSHNPSEARHRRLMYLKKLKWKKQE